MGTDGKGPQKAWLHHIGKAANPNCPCDNLTSQTGLHLTFDCLLHTHERRLLGGKDPWEAIDTPNLIKVDVNTYEDGVESFFSYLFDQLT